MAYSTGNATRDQILRRAIGEVVALHEAITLESVNEHLPNNEGPFDLDAAELAGMLAEMKIVGQRVPPPAPAKKPEPFGPITGFVDPKLFEAAPETQEKIEAPRAPQPEPPHQDATKATPEREYIIDAPATAEGYERVKRGIIEAEARRRLDEANATLGKAKERLYAAQVNLRDKRAALGTATHAWQMLADDSAADGLSPEARRQIEVRNHLASTAKEREARKARNASATAFVQEHMQNGPSRGAYSRKAAARVGYRNFDPRRGPVVKLPSEQQ